MSFKWHHFALSALMAGFLNTSAHAEPVIKVEIANIKSDKGHIHLIAFSDAKGYDALDEKAIVAHASAKAQKGSMTLQLDKLPANCCALVAFHDENDNEDLDFARNIPKEGYAFSGGKEDGEPPAFKKALVTSGTATLPLIYW